MPESPSMVWPRTSCLDSTRPLGGQKALTMKATRRRMCVLLAVVFFIAVGYCSAATSLSQCDADIAQWLPQKQPAGSIPTNFWSEPANLCTPFLVTTAYEKHCRLAPLGNGENQTEKGTRYYLTLFGYVLPLWTTSEVIVVVAD